VPEISCSLDTRVARNLENTFKNPNFCMAGLPELMSFAPVFMVFDRFSKNI
jgi:hypothetical protein